MADNVSDDLRRDALFYHRYPRAGKLEIQPTKPPANQRDLALAYTAGVAIACETIGADPGSGVARRPLPDLDAYTESLGRFVFRSGFVPARQGFCERLPVGSIPIGPAQPAHILTPSVTARGIST